MIKKSVYFLALVTAGYVYGAEEKEGSISEERSFKSNKNSPNKKRESDNPGLRSRFSFLDQDLFHDDVPEGYVQDKDALPKVQ